MASSITPASSRSSSRPLSRPRPGRRRRRLAHVVVRQARLVLAPNLDWAEARGLEPGDTVRDLGVIIEIDRIVAELVRSLYNLDVATLGTFFAGQSKLLVHDNTLPDHWLVPFDTLPVQRAARSEST